MTDTPLTDAVAEYLAARRARFHMPGHKGAHPFFGPAAMWDITEVDSCGSLYEANGPIAKTETAFAGHYGSAASLLSAGGSTLCIQAMLALACPPGSGLVAARGVHRSAVHAMALLDLHPEWIWPEQDNETGLARPVTAAQVDAALQKMPDARAVYLTSPDYFGAMCDLTAISAICRSRGVPLLVDNAHGAHLRFLGNAAAPHPMQAGADLCCDSLHKTLPVLTGGALLHIASPAFLPDAKKAMALFGSTSPSYLIMLSADLLLPRLSAEIPAKLAELARKVADLRACAKQAGFALPGGRCDPVRLAVGFGQKGYTREEFAEQLRSCGIEPEYIDRRFCVFLPGVDQPAEDFARLRDFLVSLPAKSPVPAPDFAVPPPRRACSLRAATFAPSKAIPVSDAAGQIAAAYLAPCPPAIPVVLPGEYVGRASVDILKNHGICTINVLK